VSPAPWPPALAPGSDPPTREVQAVLDTIRRARPEEDRAEALVLGIAAQVHAFVVARESLATFYAFADDLALARALLAEAVEDTTEDDVR
jgi:hypothetical protein